MDQLNRVLKVVLICLLFFSSVSSQIHTSNVGGVYRGSKIRQGVWKNRSIRYAERQIVMRTNEGIHKEDMMSMLDGYGAVILDDFNKSAPALIELPENVDIFPVITALQQHKGVRWVEPNMIGEVHSVDPYCAINGTFRPLLVV
jgi:hypothetical protein